MINGEHFRAEAERAAKGILSGSVGTGNPAAASRAAMWGEHGAELIDDEDANKATRYLLALIGSLADQNAINTQWVVRQCARKILVPLWVIAAALVWLIIRSPSF